MIKRIDPPGCYTSEKVGTMNTCKARHAEVNRDGEQIHSVSQWEPSRDSKGNPTYVGTCLLCGETVQSDGSEKRYGMEWGVALAGFGLD